MKFKALFQLSATSSLMYLLVIPNTLVSAEQIVNPVVQNAIVAQKQPMSVMGSGTFVAAEKPTTGLARIVNEGGQRFLELDQAFKTSDQGPDLHILLETAAKPPQTYSKHGSYINLGKLQKFDGAQRYPIPDSINLANYKSVAIWCRMANATFGYAPLKAGSTGASAK